MRSEDQISKGHVSCLHQTKSPNAKLIYRLHRDIQKNVYVDVIFEFVQDV